MIRMEQEYTHIGQETMWERVKKLKAVTNYIILYEQKLKEILSGSGLKVFEEI